METGHTISSHSTGDSKQTEDGWGWAGEMEGGEEEGREGGEEEGREGGEEEGREGGRKKQEGKREGREEERKGGKDFPDILVLVALSFTQYLHVCCAWARSQDLARDPLPHTQSPLSEPHPTGVCF